MATVRYTHAAHADLDLIWFQVAQSSVAAADRMIDRISQVCQTYAAHPLLGQSVEEYGRSLRCFSVGVYVVFFVPDNNGILLVRVLHGARDLDDLLRRPT